MNAIKDIEVLVSLVNAGVLPQTELVKSLKNLVNQLQEPLASTRTQMDFFETQVRLYKLLSATPIPPINATLSATATPAVKIGETDKNSC